MDVDAWGMFRQILIVTIIPVAIGFFLNVWLGHKDVFRRIQGCMPGVSVICLACIVGGVITTVHDPLVENGIVLFLLTFGMVFCHNTTGYLLGYLVGTLFHFSTAKKRTISIEVGMQNAGLGTNLAMTFFVPGHQPGHDLLRGQQSDGRRALRHLLRLAQHQRHHPGQYFRAPTNKRGAEHLILHPVKGKI